MSAPAPVQPPRRSRLRTYGVWMVFVVLVGAIVLTQYREKLQSKNDFDEFEARALVPVSSKDIGVVELFYQGTLHRFERDDKGVWFYHGHGTETAAGTHAHTADPALAPAIEKTFRGFARTRMERQFPRGELEKDYGTAAPELFVMLYAPGQLKPLLRVGIGRVAPDGVSRYVLPEGSRYVVTIANYQAENLLALLRTATGKMSVADLDAMLSGNAPAAAPASGAAGATRP